MTASYRYDVEVLHLLVSPYFAVLLDDNNRKPIARLHFNRAQKYIGIFDDNKEETRVPISSREEIYEHTEALRASVKGLCVRRPQSTKSMTQFQ